MRITPQALAESYGTTQGGITLKIQTPSHSLSPSQNYCLPARGCSLFYVASYVKALLNNFWQFR